MLRRAYDVGEENGLQFAGKTKSMRDVTLKKSPMKGLGFLSRGRAEFFTQQAPQVFVRNQRLCDVSLRREDLHEKSIATLAVRSQCDQRACGALGGRKLGA